MHGGMHICAAATGRGGRGGRRAALRRAEPSGAAPSTVLESSEALEEDPVVPDARITSPAVRGLRGAVQRGEDLRPFEVTETT